MAEEYDFFPVGPTKFIVLSIFTIGTYKLYWSYKNWDRIQRRTREPLSPSLRAVFTVWWTFSLFDRMRSHLARASMPVKWSPRELAGTYLILSLCWRLPGAWLLVGMASFLTFLPVIKSVHALNSRSEASEGRNESFSAANVLTIVIGGVLLLLVVIGSFMDTPVE
jgi:hypothetical protein